MPDNIFGKPITSEERSRIMSKIRGRGSKLETTVASWLQQASIPFEEQAKLTGKPDFYLAELNCAIFVDSAFWHGHTLPVIKERISPYWATKIEKNARRDKAVNRELKSAGITVIRLTEADVVKNAEATRKKLVSRLRRLRRKLTSELSQAGTSPSESTRT